VESTRHAFTSDIHCKVKHEDPATFLAGPIWCSGLTSQWSAIHLRARAAQAFIGFCQCRPFRPPTGTFSGLAAIRNVPANTEEIGRMFERLLPTAWPVELNATCRSIDLRARS